MTTVACNKESLAADLQFTVPDTGYKFKGKTKVYKFSANPMTYEECDFIVGFAGTASDLILVAQYFTVPESFKRPPKVNGLRGLVLTANKDIFLFDDYTRWLLVNEPYAAIGSGENVARGAMAAGASPKEAVKIASKHDAFTGMGVRELKF